MTRTIDARAKFPRLARALLAGMLALGLLAAAATGAAARGTSNTAGAIYTSSNAGEGNQALVFKRAADGSLTPAGSFATGGTGAGVGLGSQGAVTLSADGRWLLVVNAGSDDVSVFLVRPSGLSLTDVQPSGGDMPISVTISGSLVYVLNAGGAGNISGFRLGRTGDLIPLAGSTHALSGAGVGPAQAAFSPDGRTLVVTEKGTNLIDVFTIDRSGLASGVATHPSNGMTPFGFAFSPRGDLVVSEAFGGAADASALSSYHVGTGGRWALVSGSVGTTETAACWVVVAGNGRYAYTTNAGSGTVSGYALGRDGSLTLLNADGRTGATGGGPADMGLSADGRYLYALNTGSDSISVFRVGADGSLTALSGASGLPPAGYGLAAR